MKKGINFNCIYIIESLPENELKTGKNLHDDLLRRETYRRSNLHVSYHPINTKLELLSILVEIRHKAAQQLLPFLHFEIHGYTDGLVTASGESTTWTELTPYLQRINLQVRNNLFVTMSCCYGANIVNAIEPGFRSPFHGFIGPTKEVPAGEIERHYFTFFETFLHELHLAKALDALRQSSPGYTYICHTAEMIFDLAVEVQRRKFHNKAYKKKRLEELVEMNKTAPLRHSKNALKRLLQRQLLIQDSYVAEWKPYFLLKTDTRPH